MRRKWALLAGVMAVLCGVVFLFSGCSKKETPSQEMQQSISQPFTAKATIRLENMTLTADVNKTSPQKFTLKVSEPKSLEGLTFDYDGERIGISFRGMSVDIADDSLTAKFMANLILKSINAASAESGVTVTQQDDGLLIQGENENEDFEILLDRQNGSIIKVSMPEMDLECSFSDFLFQNVQDQGNGTENSSVESGNEAS